MLRLAAPLIVAFVAGCASETEVRGADESVAQNAQAEETSSAPAAAHEEGIPCQPGTTRACFRAWQDAFGVTNCENTVQYCRHDARAWLACGAAYDGTLGAQ